jgi:serine/threonine protein kinase
MEERAPPVPVVIGDVIAGKYRVERILGRGGMGEVVAARHKDLGQLFAIKVLLPRAAADPQSVDRFLNEARAAAKLKGEHVAKVTDFGRLDSGAPYIVMEHLVGTDLRTHLDARGPLPVGEAAAHVLQACDAIAEAHGAGIVHRDLKPSNLFLTRRANGTSCVKVLDFGIAGQSAQDDDDEEDGVLGTPLYMAPEQMGRTDRADSRCDVWSMGVVLYELATGTTPFHSTMTAEIIARVLQDDPEPPSHHVPGLPAVLDELVLRCLRKRPEDRFQTVDDLAAELRAAVASGAIEAPPPASIPAPGDDPDSRVILSPNVAATLDPSASDVPAAPSPAPGRRRPPPSAGQETVLIRVPRKKRGAGRVLAIGGVPAAAFAAFGVWLVLHSPPGDPSLNTTPAGPAPQGAARLAAGVPVTAATAAAPTAAVAAEPTAASVEAPPTSSVEAPPTSSVEAPPAPPTSAPATSSATAGPVSTASAPPKSAVKKPATSTSKPPPRFGGIR